MELRSAMADIADAVCDRLGLVSNDVAAHGLSYFGKVTEPRTIS